MDSLYREKGRTSKYYDFRPTQDFGQLDTLKIDDRLYKVDLSFKVVISLLNLFSSDFDNGFKVRKGLELLKLEVEDKDKSFVLDEVAKYLFNTSNKGGGEKVFDLELDYKYYYVDFKKNGIDLNKEDISWWEFDTILEGIFLQEHSTIGKVIQYRTYEKQSGSYKTAEQKEHKFYMDKKRQYALINPKSIDNGLERLYNYVKTKVGDTNE